MSRGRGAFHLAVVAVAMLDAIHRFFVLIFGRPQPIDFWLLGVDGLIVVLIAWLDVPDKLHNRRIGKRLTSLSHLMNEGLGLQRSVPDTAKEESEVLRLWMTNTKAWGNKTNQFLAACSQQASGAFLLVHDSSSADTLVFMPSGEFFHLAPSIREHYQLLLSQLNNLRHIVEKPEVYF